MDIISMIKCMCKYKIKGIYNDLSMHLINIIKFYSYVWNLSNFSIIFTSYSYY